MEEDLLKLDALFDSILEEIIHPEKAGTFVNPFIEKKPTKITELSDSVTVIMVSVTDDNMRAVCTVMSTPGRHKPFTAEDILKVARENSIFYGLDENAVNKMADEQLINTEVVIAEGLPPVKGIDGKLKLQFDVTEDHSIPNIVKDTEICHVLSPHPGRDGKDVHGRVIRGETGQNADIMLGDGLYKRGNRIYAQYDGTLVYREGQYSIVDELIISKNVDQGSGVVGYNGTIIVNGNVTNKAVIRAGRDVIVHGNVNNCIIEAEHSIHVMGRTIEASFSAKTGNITGTSFENCTLVAGGKVKASAILNCTVKCVIGVECMDDLGRITGGDVYCAGDVNCINIGSREHTVTSVSVGDASEFTTEIKDHEKKLKRLDDEIRKINDEVNQIREKEKQGIATLEEQAFVEAAIRIRTSKTAERMPHLERIEYLSSIIAIANKACIRAKSMIYGGAILNVAGHEQILNSDRPRATVRSNGSALVIT